MSNDEQHVGESYEHEEELKKRNPDERSPEERQNEQPGESVAEEGVLGSIPGARANRPTG
jgi:hypothetical protein